MFGIKKEEKKNKKKREKRSYFYFPFFMMETCQIKTASKRSDTFSCVQSTKVIFTLSKNESRSFSLDFNKKTEGIFITINRNESKYLHLIG